MKFNVLYDDSTSTSLVGDRYVTGWIPPEPSICRGAGTVPAAAEWARGWWQPQVRAMPLQEIM